MEKLELEIDDRGGEKNPFIRRRLILERWTDFPTHFPISDMARIDFLTSVIRLGERDLSEGRYSGDGGRHGDGEMNARRRVHALTRKLFSSRNKPERGFSLSSMTRVLLWIGLSRLETLSGLKGIWKEQFSVGAGASRFSEVGSSVYVVDETTPLKDYGVSLLKRSLEAVSGALGETPPPKGLKAWVRALSSRAFCLSTLAPDPSFMDDPILTGTPGASFGRKCRAREDCWRT